MDILNEKIEGLVNKAEKSGMPYGILKKVYDRGMAAWKTGHRPGTTPQQWAFARVNSFITKSSGTWGKADADLAKQVRGEQVENRTKSAKDILGQIREARYEIGFEKGEVDMVISDRPGELAMIVQDELDSERIRAKVKSTGDEFTLEFNTNIPQRKMIKILDDKFGYTAYAESKELVKEKLSKNADAGDYIDDFKKSDAPQFKGKSDKKKEKMAVAAYLDSKEEVKEENCPKCDDDPCKCENIQEQNSLTASDKSKLVKHFDKLAKDYSLSPENQDAYKAVSDYIKMKTKRVDFDDVMKKTSAMHKQDIEIEMSRIIGKSKTKKVIESKEENIQESGHTDVASMKTQVQIAKDALEKMNMELGKLGDEEDLPTWWTNKVATAVGKLDGMADYINAKSQQGDNMNEAPRQLKDPKKETMVMKVKDAGSIMVIDKKDLQKYTSKGYIQVESNLQEKEIRHDGKGPIKMSKKEYDKINKFRKGKIRGKPHVMATIKKGGFDYNMLVPVIFEEVDNITEETVFVIRFEKEGMRFATPFRRMQDAKDGEKILKKSAGVSNVSITKDILKPGIKFSEGIIVKEENLDEGKYTLPITHVIVDTRTNKVTHASYGDKSLKLDVGRKSHLKIVKLKKPESQKKTGYLLGEPLKAWGEEVDDNSMMARTTRLISQTAIREKKDPADMDMVATDLDRKAADKNIFIQLKRAQDMKGKTDVEFLDKKKQKVDIKIINKALDMFDKMKPNDKLKMQLAIGKSYRDLLKVIQRGKV